MLSSRARRAYGRPLRNTPLHGRHGTSRFLSSRRRLSAAARSLSYAMLRLLLASLFAHGVTALSVVDYGLASTAKGLPFENKDAYFTAPPNFYGVFDGVSSMPQSRVYAQTLAKTSCDTLLQSQRGNPKGEWTAQACSALTAATAAAQEYRGSSTAILLKMELEQSPPLACVYSVGDCQTLVLRKAAGAEEYAIAETTIDKIHPENGAPYQFGGEKLQTDKPEDGDAYAFEVLPGDILLCYTDGITDNMQPAEIETLINIQADNPASEIAEVLVEAARLRQAVDDDCTAVAVKLGDGRWVGGDMAVQTTPTDGEAVKNAAFGWFKARFAEMGEGDEE